MFNQRRRGYGKYMVNIEDDMDIVDAIFDEEMENLDDACKEEDI